MSRGHMESDRLAVREVLATATERELTNENPQWFIDAVAKLTGRSVDASSLAWACCRATINTPQEETGRRLRSRLDKLQHHRKRARPAQTTPMFVMEVAPVPVVAVAPTMPAVVPASGITNKEAGVLFGGISRDAARSRIQKAGIRAIGKVATAGGGRDTTYYPRASVEALARQSKAEPKWVRVEAPTAQPTPLRTSVLRLFLDGTISEQEVRVMLSPKKT